MGTLAQGLRKHLLLFLPLVGALILSAGCGSSSQSNPIVSWPSNQSVYVSQSTEVNSFLISSSLAKSGNAAPTTALTATTFMDTHRTAFDSLGRMYETDLNTGSVFIFPSGATTGSVAPTATIAMTAPAGNGDATASGIAIDSSNNVYVSDEGNNAIDVYSAVAADATGTLAASPVYTIYGASTTLNAPNGIALNSTGTKLWVANEAGDDVLCFTLPTAVVSGAQNLAPTATITNSAFSTVHSLALDSTDLVYVTNSSTTSSAVFVYSPSSNGVATPVSIISGNKTGLSGLNGISLDSEGNIYVGNNYVVTTSGKTTNAAEILVFPAGSTGNVPPGFIIGGSNTGLTPTIHGVTVGPIPTPET